MDKGQEITKKTEDLGLGAQVEPKTSSSWREDPFQAYMDWVYNNLGPEAAQRTSVNMFKMMLRAESKWQIGIMRLFLKKKTEYGDSLFDKTRQIVVGIARGLPEYPLFAEQSEAKQAEIQRWLFATYVEGLVNSTKSNSQFDASVKGIAWSLLAKDAPTVLRDRGQAIDSKWLFGTMGSLIREGQDKNLIKQELSRFVSGDPEVIHAQPVSSNS